ncbi:MAG TPA: hypothetical protein VD737_04860, partial [Steroidobacteraceae bacterium]|nr:hypothetical protein [Steroidobacteraceae bacterium]
MKRLIGLCAWLACLPAFGADAVSELQLRRAGNESGVLRAVIPEGTVGFCRDQPSVAKAVEAHVHGSRELRLLECFVQPAARVALQPV